MHLSFHYCTYSTYMQSGGRGCVGTIERAVSGIASGDSQTVRQTVSCLVGHSDYCEAYKQQLSGYLLYLPIVHQVCTVRIDCSRGMYPCRCNQWMQKYKSGVESQS